MNCKYFSVCASCTLFDKTYEQQLQHKINREKERFLDLTNMEFDIIKSSDSNFRNRAEFLQFFVSNFHERLLLRLRQI